jgi:polar amino acid transport system substrate-binding protein
MRIVLVLLFSINIVFSQSLKVGFVKDIPPYVIEKSNSGIEIDIIKSALEPFGYTIEPIYVSFKRGKNSLKNGSIDVMTTMKDKQEKDIYYSKDYIEYKNYIYHLKNNNLKIDNLSDLKNYSLIAWQDANKMLTKEYCDTFKDNSKKYRELVNQEQQCKMFWANRVDSIIIDERIFNYYKKDLINSVNTNQQYIKNGKLSLNTSFKVAFKDKKIRDDFDKGLEKIKKNGKYKKIFKKYE